ncbi:ADP-ribosylation factor-binding protein GGA3 [Larimichthys crocea]|uniref:Uncharacterized protein n=1 Tax=Larimichthys crocea TaxID=215358 RepID=A0ACD3R868_LARCR|nr:ADP-ribosylation factor-binding protein GGA3 [Larimichthys crocea]
MGKLLAELLRSKNPEDLQEANRLIKNMVKEDEARVHKVTKRIHTLEEVNINVKLLTEMLTHYNKDSSTESDKEIIKELYERCDKLRRAAFKMATETEDNDASLGEILQASDDLSRVINSYKKIVEGQPINGDSEEPPSTADHRESAETTDTLIDLAGLDTPSPPQPAALPSQTLNLISNNPTISPIPVLPPPPKHLAGSHGRLNDPPTSLSNQSKPKLSELSNQWTSLQTPASSVDLFSTVACSGPVVAPAEPAAATHSLQNLQDLAYDGLFRSQEGSPAKATDISLSNVHIPLEAIRPSKVLPVTAYDKDGVRMLLNFASDCPPGRPDVLVMVVSMLNTAPLPVNNVVLQAAVPKSMKVKLQPPSGTELAPFNPILPPASITQIMLLANPAKEKVRLRYKLAFTLGDRLCNEVGEVDQFPPQETWGHL